MHACPGCGAFTSAERHCCDHCGRPLAGEGPTAEATPRHLSRVLRHPGAIEGEAKALSVLFLDIQDSMGLAGRLGPERWHTLLDRFFRLVTATIGRFGGTVNQYTGDGAMVLFGAPLAQEDHARRACDAALALGAALRPFAAAILAELGVTVGVRMGINSGEAVVGRIGEDLRRDYTAQGQSVGLAERMQRIAPPGEAVITGRTASLVEGFFDLESLGLVEAKGAGDPLHAYRLLRARPEAGRLERSRRRGLSRFVGRERELAHLEALAAAVRPDRGQIIGVVGAAGVGKSRLCQELAAGRRALGWSVFEAHGLAHRREVSGLALAELARALLSPDGRDTPLTTQEGVHPALAELLGLGEATPAPAAPASEPEHATGGAPEERARALGQAVAELLRERSRHAPLLVLLDDAHWMDAASLSALEVTLAAAASCAAMVLINFRPDFIPPGARRSDYQQVAVPPLDDGASQALLADLIGEHPSLGEMPERLREHAAGNPFFLEEMVRALVESGALTGERGERRMPQPVEVLTPPPDVHALLSARIDRLAEREKRVLETAAVIGRRFTAPLVARVAALSAVETTRALAMLEQAELLRDDGGAEQYRFEHPLIQEVAYRSQLAERRQLAHAAVALALEDVFADRLGETAVVVAHHWQAAGRAAAARRWQRLAALRVTHIQPRRRGV